MTLSVVLVGAGQRGRYVYGAFAQANPDRMRVVAVVDPDENRRNTLGRILGIGERGRLPSAGDVAADADAWIVASGDRHHLTPALQAFERGAHVLVEKPIAASYPDSVTMVEAAHNAGRQLHVSHVLRYTPFFTTLNRVLADGAIGDIVHVDHRENVAYWHMAHSFVRGNWSNEATSTPMIVQKCCHDFDILEWNASSPVTRLHSTGSLYEFHPHRAPDGATARCTDACPAAGTCPYDATRLYMNPAWQGWPVHVLTDDLSPAGRRSALETGRYGRCVYTAGSDVVDHQVVVMERADGSTATLTMHGHAAEESRTMRYDGTKGTLRARFGAHPSITVQRHGSRNAESVDIPPATGGHGGGDPGLIASFVDAVRDGAPSKTSGTSALESHLLAFSAEESRLSDQPIDLETRRLHDWSQSDA